MRIAVVNCEDAEKWHDHVEILSRAYKGEVNNNDNDNADEFVEYKAFQNEIPTEEELQGFDGVIIPGSRYSANDHLPWLKGVEDMIVNIVDNRRPQLFCNCFGHQLLSKALGGTVTKNVDNKFVFRSEEIQFIKSNMSDLPYAKDLIDRKDTFLLLESHGDCVSKLPSNIEALKKIAISKGSANECFVIGDFVLSIQAHPEFTGNLVNERIFDTLREKGRLNNEEEANKCKESVLNKKVNECNIVFRNVVYQVFSPSYIYLLNS